MSKAKFLNEAEVLKRIKHPNIISFLGVCSKNEPFVIVFELEERNDLLKFLKSPENENLKTKERTSICYQVTQKYSFSLPMND